MLCNSNVGMVDAVVKQHPGRFKAVHRPAADHRAELDALQIESHGIVCKLGDKVLWKKADHKVSKAELDAGVTAVLAQLK